MRSIALLLLAIWFCIGTPFPARSEALPAIAPPSTAPVQSVDAASLSSMSSVHVTKFSFTGNTVVSSTELETATRSYLNRELPYEELERLRQMLSKLYIDRGYVNSGVIIPDQVVSDGVVSMTVVEGTLDRIDIEGVKHFRPGYIAARLDASAAKPVNLNRLQEALQFLQQDSRIKRIHADFKPGALLGEAIMKVAIEENSPYLASLSFSNHASPSTGSYRGELNLAHQNLIGMGDILSAGFGLTDGTREYSATYAIPLNSRDSLLELYFRLGDSTVTESLFKGLDIRSESDSYGLRVRQPLFKTLSKEFSLSLAAETKRSTTYLLGRPFAFSAGSEDGANRETVLRFSQDWLERSESTVFAVHSSFSLGIDALGSSIRDAGADGRFFAWLGQLLLIKRLGVMPGQILFRTDMQWTADQLLSLEKYSLGGMGSVRGYRKDVLVRDNGVNSSLELRIPLLSPEAGYGSLQAVPFFDFGWASNNKSDAGGAKSIYSIGAGLKWELAKRVNLDIFYGYGLTSVGERGNDLQDQGFHFQLTTQIF
ncbi:MAG: ShlB/FhaC/HecB family hemolysin secretion/activation protein [Desulfuromonadales bacterium]